MTLIKFGSMAREELCQRNQDMWRTTLDDAVGRLEGLRFITADDVIELDKTVPSAYLRLIEKVWEYLEGTHRLYPSFNDEIMKRPATFRQRADGAARLFGTDVRLRNLMALAKYGPMRMLDLRRIAGNERPHDESYSYAQFGRGSVARVWGEGYDRAVMLDPSYPVALPLHRLLVALERVYPLAEYVPDKEPPTPPEPEPWAGNRLALFGPPVPTHILTSIGVMGWTFEALCCTLAGGHHRKVVKHAMKTLEGQGVIQGDDRVGRGWTCES